MAFRKHDLQILVCLAAHVLNSPRLAVFAELVPAEETEQDKEHTCETLLMCIVTVLSHGLRSGGGVGDVLRKPSKEVAAPQGKEERGAGWRGERSAVGSSVNCRRGGSASAESGDG